MNKGYVTFDGHVAWIDFGRGFPPVVTLPYRPGASISVWDDNGTSSPLCTGGAIGGVLVWPSDSSKVAAYLAKTLKLPVVKRESIPC